MSSMVKKQFAQVEALKDLPKCRFEMMEINGANVFRYTFDTGWHWGEHAGPFAGADTCTEPHILFTVSGRLGVKMDDGTTEEAGEGECIVIPPGHDAWTIGDEPYVGIDLGPQLYQHLAQNHSD